MGTTDALNIVTSEDACEINDDGSFNRQRNRFETPFGFESGQLPVEADRYRLLWAPVCPWAHRAIIVRELLGLQKVISVGTANPIRTDRGWEFSLDAAGKDPVLGIRFLSEIYAKTDPGYTGRATVPLVADVVTGKAVNNDYHNLTYYLETVFKSFHAKNAPDLYPEDIREEIRDFNAMLFSDVNNGVYKAGFAHSQKAYEKAYDALFSRLDELEARLSTRRYLFGERMTDSDIRLYVTLVRFDVAYYSVFRTNRNRIIDFPNLWNYAKDLYQTGGFGDTTDFEAIKKGYQLGGNPNNPYDILAKGPDVTVWEEAHDRERFSR